jgi:hypothetical protein
VVVLVVMLVAMLVVMWTGHRSPLRHRPDLDLLTLELRRHRDDEGPDLAADVEQYRSLPGVAVVVHRAWLPAVGDVVVQGGRRRLVERRPPWSGMSEIGACQLCAVPGMLW